MQRTCVLIALLCSLVITCDNFQVEEDESSLFSNIIGEKTYLGHHIDAIRMKLEYRFVADEEKTELFTHLNTIRQKADNLHLAEWNHHTAFQYLMTELSNIDSIEFSCTNPCNIYDCQIFNNFTESKAFLVNATCDFLRELLDDSRDQVVHLFLKSYSISLPESVATLKDPFLLSMLQLLQNQTLTNPSYYVSHGVDHSVRVMEWNYNLRQVVSPAMSNLYGCTLSDPSDVDGTNSTCTWILMLDGLLHDTGYIDISGTHGVKKFVHAVSGSVLDEILFQENSYIGMTVVNSAGNFSGNSSQLVSDAFIRSIKTHNNDDQSCLWIDGNPNYNSSCSSVTTPLLNSSGYPTPVVRNYTQPEATLDPLSFIIRVSDNLDSMKSRLTSEQMDENFMTFLCYLYTDNELRISGNSPSAQPAARQRAIDAVQKLNSSNPWNTSEIMGMLNSTDLQSFLFFYSVWMVDQINVTWTPDFSSFQLFVQIHEPSGNECDHCYLGFKSHPGPTLYQINRLAISMHSLFIQNSSFLNKISVQLSQPVPGINGSTFYLKDFTQKEVFNSSGPTGQYICEDCQFYLPLTNSPENCLDDSGNVVTCADVTSLGSPFADLSYETSLAPDYPQCKPVPPPLRRKWWFWLVTIAVPILVVLALVVTIVVVMKVRHRKGYTRIESKE